MQLLRNIPWKENHTTDKSDLKSEWAFVESIKWICAKYAARYFTDEEQPDELFKLLYEIQFWNDENSKFVFIKKLDSYLDNKFVYFSRRWIDLRFVVKVRECCFKNN